MTTKIDNNEQIGIIKWFDKIRGFGVIVTANDEEYYIHSSNIIEIPEKILVATSVVFEKGLQKGKKTALNCRIPTTKEDFILALQLVGHKRNLRIEVEVKGKSKWGNPYVKKEFRDYDILIYYLYKLLNNKSYDIVKEYFITGFIEILQENDINKLIDYCKITKNRIKAIELTKIPNIKLEQPESLDNTNEPLLRRLRIKKSPNDLLIEELINYYDENSSNFIKFAIWQKGEYYEHSAIDDIYGSHLGSDVKLNPPFNENIFIEFCDKLQYDDFKIIKKYNISEVTQTKIIEHFINGTYQTFDELKNAIGIINTFAIKPDLFDIILQRISNDLYFQVWSLKKVFINYENKSFSLDFPYKNDYEIPINILELKANEITINLIERISKFSTNKNGSWNNFVELLKSGKNSVLKVIKISKPKSSSFNHFDFIIKPFDNAGGKSGVKIIENIVFPIVQSINKGI